MSDNHNTTTTNSSTTNSNSNSSKCSSNNNTHHDDDVVTCTGTGTDTDTSVIRPHSAPSSSNSNGVGVSLDRGDGVDGNNHNNNGNKGEALSSPIPASNTTTTTNKASAAMIQIQKLRDANTKYKNLLKLAKERIEQQEQELKVWKDGGGGGGGVDIGSNSNMKGSKSNNHIHAATFGKKMSSSFVEDDVMSSGSKMGWYDENNDTNMDNHQYSPYYYTYFENNYRIVRVNQRIKVDLEPQEVSINGGRTEEIWALLEYESLLDPEDMIAASAAATGSSGGGGGAATSLSSPSPFPQYPTSAPPHNNRIKRWKRFDTEADFYDAIRRNTGEPVKVPPYSLTPQQSAMITNQAQFNVQTITEEFRRFRVKSEMTRKQMDSHIRELQSATVESAKRRIEGQHDVVSKQSPDSTTTLLNVQPHNQNQQKNQKIIKQSNNNNMEQFRAALAKQEAQWKESYDLLLQENEALKSSGSEALLASQWRQRYEVCQKEKEELVNKLKMAEQQQQSIYYGGASGSGDDEKTKLERKYRDLKESFRLYRKKAKEIFEAHHIHNIGTSGIGNDETNNNGVADEESKMSYLKNLMVNYLTSDPEVRDHMETAIGTVLQFSSDDLDKIKAKKKQADESWGLFSK